MKPSEGGLVKTAVISCIQPDLRGEFLKFLKHLGYQDEEIIGPLPLPGGSYLRELAKEWLKEAVALFDVRTIVIVHHIPCKKFEAEGLENDIQTHEREIEKTIRDLNEDFPGLVIKAFIADTSQGVIHPENTTTLPDKALA